MRPTTASSWVDATLLVLDHMMSAIEGAYAGVPPAGRVALYLAIAVLLTGWFAFWNARVPTIGSFNQASQDYVDMTVRMRDEYPGLRTGGFLVQSDQHLRPKAKAAYLAQLNGGDRDPKSVPDPEHNTVHSLYFSQFGLQGRVASLLYRIPGLHGSVETYSRLVRLANMALLAATLSALVFATTAEFGAWSGLVTLIGLANGVWIIRFSGNVYWVIWTAFLPFLAAWLFYARWRTRRRLAFLALLAVLVAIKALCGYEFVTAVAIAPAAPVLYYELRAGAPVRAALWRSAVAIGAGTFGFLCALALHAVALATYLRDPMAALAHMEDRAASRSFGEVENHFALHHWSAYDAYVAVRYIKAAMFQVTASRAVPFWLVIISSLALAVLWWQVRGRRFDPSSRIWALCAASLMAAAASLSWMVFAPSHTRHHWFLDPIIYSLPLLPTLFALAGLMTRELAGAPGQTAKA